MDAFEVVRRRLSAQRLTGAGFGSPAEAVAGLGAVQSQEFGEALWSVAQRSGHPGEAVVEEAFAAGEILRTHVLRPTWHFVLPEDIEWMLRLTGPRLAAGDRSRLRQLDVSGEMVDRAGEVAEAAIAEAGPLTRTELRARLAEEGIETDASQIAHITFQLELRCLLCSGPARAGKPTYALLADRVGERRELDGDEALAELTRRYLVSHAPATTADLAWWGGLTLGSTRRGIELCGDRFEAREDDEGRTWYLDPAAPAPEPAEGALMLGSFDELTVAYRDLRTVGPAGEPSRTLPLRPLLLDGRLAGSWRRRLGTDDVRIELAIHNPLAAAEEAGLAAEAERYGEHLARAAVVEIVPGEPVAAA
ncbi:MAG TPA: winged helix DNA-binding domain-containing protein [Solirubrobacterales bacterium]